MLFMCVLKKYIKRTTIFSIISCFIIKIIITILNNTGKFIFLVDNSTKKILKDSF